jgi:hypothetical protein
MSSSPKQARPYSTPKKVTLTSGAKIMQPMDAKRVTPTSKTKAKSYPGARCC